MRAILRSSLSRQAALARPAPRLASTLAGITARPLPALARSLAPLSLSATRLHVAQLHSSTPAQAQPRLSRELPEHVPGTEMGPLGLTKIRDNYGARLTKTRIGRGVGSGRGRKSGRGMKGKKARAGNHGFLKQAGGQTSMIKAIPKRGFYKEKKEYAHVNLYEIQVRQLTRQLDSTRIMETPAHAEAGAGTDARVAAVANLRPAAAGGPLSLV